MRLLHRDKKRHIIYCEQVLKESERSAEVESIKLIDKFKNQRKHVFRELTNVDDEDMYDKYEDKLMESITALEDELMGVEMKLQDTLGAATQDF